MTWILLLVLFSGSDVVDGRMVKMDSEQECAEYKAKWEEKMRPSPYILVAECKSFAAPEQPKLQLKKERDS